MVAKKKVAKKKVAKKVAKKKVAKKRKQLVFVIVSQLIDLTIALQL